MGHFLLLVLAFVSFLSLCAGLPRYQTGLCGRKLSHQASFKARASAWILLVLLFAAACALFGIGRGLVLAAAYASAGAGITVSLANRRHRGGTARR